MADAGSLLTCRVPAPPAEGRVALAYRVRSGPAARTVSDQHKTQTGSDPEGAARLRLFKPRS